MIADSIEIHAKQAPYYKYRTPYVHSLFDRVCSEISVKKNSSLLDIGCGCGEVSCILSKFSNKIYAVDGSQAMIDHAIKNNNVSYRVMEINENILPEETVDHIFFGRSVHWFSSAVIKKLRNNIASDLGKIVVCSTQCQPIGEWGNVYHAIKRKFASVIKRPEIDYSGERIMREAGVRSEKRLMASADMNVDIGYMYNHAFSEAYRENLQNLEENSGDFNDLLQKNLSHFEASGAMKLKIFSWAIIYS